MLNMEVMEKIGNVDNSFHGHSHSIPFDGRVLWTNTEGILVVRCQLIGGGGYMYQDIYTCHNNSHGGKKMEYE